jgi:hypothetical protein
MPCLPDCPEQYLTSQVIVTTSAEAAVVEFAGVGLPVSADTIHNQLEGRPTPREHRGLVWPGEGRRAVAEHNGTWLHDILGYLSSRQIQGCNRKEDLGQVV